MFENVCCEKPWLDRFQYVHNYSLCLFLLFVVAHVHYGSVMAAFQYVQMWWMDLLITVDMSWHNLEHYANGYVKKRHSYSSQHIAQEQNDGYFAADFFELFVDFIYRYPISKWVAEGWLHDYKKATQSWPPEFAFPVDMTPLMFRPLCIAIVRQFVPEIRKLLSVMEFDSLALRRCGSNFKSVIFKLNIQNSSLVTGCQVAIRLMPQNLTNEGQHCFR